MTDKQTPPDWILIEAAKRFGWNDVSEYLSAYYQTNDPPGYRALCDMIERYEQPPVDRKVLCAREAIEEAVRARVGWSQAEVCVRAVELYLEGYGE